ncbi:hypothetical protein G7054_g7832 [Neopestalotiopsis clavispora]|nr:hypothetical protein G7054_g7832 [Neopestalotiopsis clavispora]
MTVIHLLDIDPQWIEGVTPHTPWTDQFELYTHRNPSTPIPRVIQDNDDERDHSSPTPPIDLDDTDEVESLTEDEFTDDDGDDDDDDDYDDVDNGDDAGWQPWAPAPPVDSRCSLSLELPSFLLSHHPFR